MILLRFTGGDESLLFKKMFLSLLILNFGFLIDLPCLQAQKISKFISSDGSQIFSNTDDLKQFFKRQQLHKFDKKKKVLPRSTSKNPSYQIIQLINQIATQHDIDPALVNAVARVESNFNPRAVSPKGALGVMQLLPSTAKRFDVHDVYDPKQNIEGSVRYLKFLRNMFSGNIPLMLAAYNAGENAVKKYNGIPPYTETQNYIRKIQQFYKKKTLSSQKKSALKSNIIIYQNKTGEIFYSNLERDYQ